MILHKRVLQFFLMVAVAFAAALLVAPVNAAAHEGHGYTVTAPAATFTNTIQASAIAASIKASVSVALSKADCHPSSDMPSGKTSTDCPCGCSLGMTCCGLVIGGEFPVLIGPSPQRLLIEHRAHEPAGRAPDALLEPPNTLG
jgi:hypothetical protein